MENLLYSSPTLCRNTCSYLMGVICCPVVTSHCAIRGLNKKKVLNFRVVLILPLTITA